MCNTDVKHPDCSVCLPVVGYVIFQFTFQDFLTEILILITIQPKPKETEEQLRRKGTFST